MLILLRSKPYKNTLNCISVLQRGFLNSGNLFSSTGISSILRRKFSSSRVLLYPYSSWRKPQKVKLQHVRFCSSAMASDGNHVQTNIIAVCQLASKNDVKENFRMCKDMVEKAKARRAKMVFLPEGYDYLAENKQESIAMAQSIDGPRMKEMCQLAKDNDIWLSLGGFHNMKPMSNDNKISNTHVMVDNNGNIVETYDKVHLFDVDIPNGPCLKESDSSVPGDKIAPPVTTPVGKVGMAICYDVRFPEMALSLAKQGADIITFPSAFTYTTGAAHWEILLRSRAIETQCYIVAAAQTGQNTSKRKCYGHSMVVDPWGTIVAQCQEGTGMCIAEIDHKYLTQIRRQMPLWSHRRPDLYGDFTPKL